MADCIKNQWLWLSSTDLATELAQLKEEGRDVGRLKGAFDELIALGDDVLFEDVNQRKAEALLDKAQRLHLVKSYSYIEPSDLDGIRAQRPKGPRIFKEKLSDKMLMNRIHGAWLGRCCGCLLGKPLEGVYTSDFWPFLADTRQWPISGYIKFGFKGKVAKKYSRLVKKAWFDTVDHMPLDDDINYTVTGYAIAQKHGKDFTSGNVAQFWMEKIPLLYACTAERIAYRNFSQHIQPPASALYRNPYREWIGAQIRADAFGYVSMGNPQQAAEFAWRDARISHIKNGIYGEMFIAAMIAAAPYCKTVERIIDIGLSEIPEKSRLRADIDTVRAWYAEGISYDEFVTRIHARWNEKNWHEWTHTNSNASICVGALLYSENDFGKAICRSVQPGFDTDCNGATVGSIMGAFLGTKGIGPEWTEKINDSANTSIRGYERISISDMAKKTFEVYRR